MQNDEFPSLIVGPDGNVAPAQFLGSGGRMPVLHMIKTKL